MAGNCLVKMGEHDQAANIYRDAFSTSVVTNSNNNSIKEDDVNVQKSAADASPPEVQTVQFRKEQVLKEQTGLKEQAVQLVKELSASSSMTSSKSASSRPVAAEKTDGIAESITHAPVSITDLDLSAMVARAERFDKINHDNFSGVFSL